MTAGFHEQKFSLEKRGDQAGLFWGMAGWAQGIHRHGKHGTLRQS